MCDTKRVNILNLNVSLSCTSISTSETFSKMQYNLSLLRAFITSSCFRVFFLPKLPFPVKDHCIVTSYYCYDPLEVPQLPFLFLPTVLHLATLVHWPCYLTAQLPSSPLPVLLCYTVHKALTRCAATSPSLMIHLLPAGSHAETDSCLNVYVESYFLFL